MANGINENLFAGDVVQLVNGEVFRVEGGFGLSNHTHGSAVFGYNLTLKREERISGHDIRVLLERRPGGDE